MILITRTLLLAIRTAATSFSKPVASVFNFLWSALRNGCSWRVNLQITLSETGRKQSFDDCHHPHEMQFRFRRYRNPD